jgi:hypothetical protein
VRPRDGADQTVLHVGKDGRFTVALEPGVYEVHGSSPYFGDGEYDCRAERAVRIGAGTTVHADVYCSMR